MLAEKCQCKFVKGRQLMVVTKTVLGWLLSERNKMIIILILVANTMTINLHFRCEGKVTTYTINPHLDKVVYFNLR